MFLKLLLGVFALGHLARISIFDSKVNFYIYEFLLLAFVIYLVIKFWLKPLLKTRKWIYYFVGSLVLSYLVSFPSYHGVENIFAGLYLLRVISYFLFFLYIQHYLKNRNGKEYTASIKLFSGLLVILSFAQYFLYPNLRNLYYLGWDPHQFRVFGTYFESSVAAAIFGLTGFYLYFSSLFKQRIKQLILLAISILAALTYSRGFFLALSLTLTFYLVKRELYKQIAFLITVLIALYFVLPKPFGEGVNLLRTSTIEARLVDYQEGIRVWQKNPIFGIGYNHLPSIKQSKNLSSEIPDHSLSAFHSSFITILAASGIFGLIAFFGLLIYFARVSEVALLMTIFLSIFSLTDNILLQPFVLFLYLYLMIGEISLSRKLR